MLRHEEPNESTAGTRPGGDVPAAQVRVTAEEFARAVARYQAKREEAARRMEGTVSLGDAVRELDLDATPEEILAEVEAERAGKIAPAARTTSRLSPLLAALTGAGVTLALMFILWAVRWGYTEAQSGPATPAPVSVATLATPAAVTLDAPGRTLVQDARGGRPVLRTLAEVPDGVPVRCELDQTDGRASLTSFSNPNSAWTVIKHGGRLYIRGWIPNMSAQAIAASGVTLYNQKTVVASGVSPIPVTLPVDGFQLQTAGGDDEMILAQDVHPDGHFRERW